MQTSISVLHHEQTNLLSPIQFGVSAAQQGTPADGLASGEASLAALGAAELGRYAL